MLQKNLLPNYQVGIFGLCLIISLVSLNAGCTPNSFFGSEEGKSKDLDLTQGEHSLTDPHQAGASHQDAPLRSFTTVDAFVAGRDIKREEPLTEDNVAYRCFTPNDLPPNFITDVTQVITQAARIDILQGQIITQEMLTPTHLITSPLAFEATPIPSRDNQTQMLADVVYSIEWAEFVNVIVAKRDIEWGTAITADDLRTKCWPTTVLPIDFIVDQTEIISYVTKIDIDQARSLAHRLLLPPDQSIKLDEDEVIIPRKPFSLADHIYDNQGERMIDVFVAEQAIQQGETITSEVISLQPRSLELTPLGFIIDETDIIGRVATTNIAKEM